MEDIIYQINASTPWGWYITRASGLIAFAFLWLAVFLGLAIKNRLLQRIIKPIYSFGLHCYLAALAVFWALVHATSLAILHNNNISFSVGEIFIPFYSKTTLVNPIYMALGILAFYAMIVIAITSYLKQHLNYWLWRVIHFLNPLVFIFVVVHGYMNGTEMKDPTFSLLFLFSSFILIALYLFNLSGLLIQSVKQLKQ